MDAEAVWQAVQLELQGLPGLETTFHPNEVYACMNRAQNIVNRDIFMYSDKYSVADFTETDPDDFSDLAPASDIEDLPALAVATAQCQLPNYCFEALVVKSVELLNQKTGEYPNAIKNKRLLAERYAMELGKAIEIKAKLNPKKAVCVIDAKDPNRGYRTRF